MQTQVEGEESILRVPIAASASLPIYSPVCLTSLPRGSAIWTVRKAARHRTDAGASSGRTAWGRVDAYSAGASKGSTFVVRLPRAESRRTDDPPLASVARLAPARRILIVEDDADGREALRMQ